jgi:hypothetical protein
MPLFERWTASLRRACSPFFWDASRYLALFEEAFGVHPLGWPRERLAELHIEAREGLELSSL